MVLNLINDIFSSNLEKYKNIYSLCHYFDENNIEWGIVGGAARNLYQLSNIDSIRDIDIIAGCSSHVIANYLKLHNYQYRINSFGGFKFRMNELDVDMWSIDDHYMFKNNIYKKRFENIPKTTFISYDSIFYNASRDRFYDENYKKTIEKNEITTVGNNLAIHNNPNLPLSICKIYELKLKNDFSISSRLRKVILEYIEKQKSKEMLADKLCQAYGMHYHKTIPQTILDAIVLSYC